MRNISYFVLVLLLLLLLTSCVNPEVDARNNSNPFENEHDLKTPLSSFDLNHFKAVVITDEHINKGKGRHYNENFYNFLGNENEKKYPFVISLGDLSDDGEVSEDVLSFREEIVKRTGCFLEAIGNHDRHEFEYRSFDIFSLVVKGLLKIDINGKTYADYILSSKTHSFTTGRYVWGDALSIYVLDTSRRNISLKQTEYLKETLKKDNSMYKIALSHNNIITGKDLDKSLFMGGIGDVEELTRLLNVLEEGGVSLVMSGHQHKALSPIKGDKYSEMNFSSYLSTDSPFEGRGSWYEVEFDGERGEISFQEYDAKSSEKVGNKEVFKLKKTR